MARGSPLTVAGAATASVDETSPRSLLIPEGNHRFRIVMSARRCLSRRISARTGRSRPPGNESPAVEPADTSARAASLACRNFSHYRKLTRLGIGPNKIAASNLWGFSTRQQRVGGPVITGKYAPVILLFGDICQSRAQPPRKADISLDVGRSERVHRLNGLRVTASGRPRARRLTEMVDRHPQSRRRAA